MIVKEVNRKSLTSSKMVSLRLIWRWLAIKQGGFKRGSRLRSRLLEHIKTGKKINLSFLYIHFWHCACIAPLLVIGSLFRKQEDPSLREDHRVKSHNNLVRQRTSIKGSKRAKWERMIKTTMECKYGNWKILSLTFKGSECFHWRLKDTCFFCRKLES